MRVIANDDAIDKCWKQCTSMLDVQAENMIECAEMSDIVNRRVSSSSKTAVEVCRWRGGIDDFNHSVRLNRVKPGRFFVSLHSAFRVKARMADVHNARLRTGSYR